MCDAEAWLDLIRNAGLHPWRLEGDEVALLARPAGLDDRLPGGRHIRLADIFGTGGADIRTWADGRGNPTALFPLQGPLGGEGTVELVRGPRCGGAIYGTFRLQGRHPGRAQLERDLTTAMIAAVHDGSALGLVLVGVRDFDLVRDGIGQLGADNVIAEVAAKLAHVAGGGTVYRVDTACVALVLSTVPATDPLAPVATILEAAFDGPMELGGLFHRLLGRAGVAVFPADASNIEDLLHGASLALGAALRSRDDTVVRVDPGWLERMRDDVHLAASLGEGIARRQFSFDLQPIIDLDTGGVASAEALARWNHPVLGRVPPARFVPLAERQDIMLDMTIAMLRRLDRDAQAKGLPAIRIAINLAPGDFSWRKVTRLMNTIRHEDLLPLDRLTIEITETGMMENADGKAASVASSLREQGVALAIDDFGSGYSSFGQLGQLPVDILKIDRSLAQDVHLRPDRQRLVAAITTMAHQFGMTTVVEGLEEPDEVAMAREIGCDRVQGYVFSRPLDVGGFAEYCGRQAA